MSRTVYSYGLMVPLKEYLSREKRAEISDKLDDMNSKIQINYEGTLAFTDDGGTDDEYYGISFGNKSTKNIDVNEFVLLSEFGVEIVTDKMSTYNCTWYNGCDSDMSVMTLSRFIEETL